MSVWTDERVSALSRMWGEGLSGGQIAARFAHPKITRNSVISKVHRLGLAETKPRRPQTKSSRRPKKPRPLGQQPVFGPTTRERLPPTDIAAIEVVTADDPPATERISLDDLKDHHCKWALGEVGHDDFGFCGRSRVPRSSYCEAHTLRSKQGSSPRIRRQRSHELKRTPINSEFV